MNKLRTARYYCNRSVTADPDYWPSLALTPMVLGITEMGQLPGCDDLIPSLIPEELHTEELVRGGDMKRSSDHSQCQACLFGALASHAGHPRLLIHMAQCLAGMGEQHRSQEFGAEALGGGEDKSYVLKWG